MANSVCIDTSLPIPECFRVTDAVLFGTCVSSLNFLTKAALCMAGPRPCLPYLNYPQIAYVAFRSIYWDSLPDTLDLSWLLNSILFYFIIVLRYF